MNSREMLLSLIDRYILEEADRRKQYNDNQVMIDLYEEVLKILKGDYQEIIRRLKITLYVYLFYLIRYIIMIFIMKNFIVYY